MTRVSTIAVISRPVEEVFDYVTTPATWPRWHPSSLAVSGAIDHSLGLGEQVTEEFRVARRGTVVWTVREALPPLRWTIEGEIVGGNSGGTVTYALAPVPGGTRFWREFAYELRGPVVRALDGLVLRRRVEDESDEALGRLKDVLEGREAHEAAGGHGASSDSRASYHLVTHWRVEGSVEEVAEILGDPLDLPRWWPAVYLRVEEVAPGDEHHVGRVVRLLGRGWLPYTLDWEFVVTESRPPDVYGIEARGDLAGEGAWTFRQDDRYVDVTYDWQVRIEQPILRRLSLILKPIFSANHYWAMGQGKRSLELELARRHARTPEEASRVPAPPRHTSPRSALLPLAGLAAMAAALAYGLGRLRRGRVMG